MEKLITLMGLYSRRGIADWRSTSDSLRTEVRRALGNAGVVRNEAEAVQTINRYWNQDKLQCHKFIPMPRRPGKEGTCWFFLPIRQRTSDGADLISFEVFVLIEQEHRLAFRFEPADRDSTHDYGHVQLTKSLRKKTLDAQIVSWLPDSYPAFPIGTSDPLDIFLAMAVSVHGNTGGFVHLLQRMLQMANRSNEYRFYEERLQEVLFRFASEEGSADNSERSRL